MTTLAWKALRAWLWRRPVKIKMRDGEDWVEFSVPTFRRARELHAYYRKLGFR